MTLLTVPGWVGVQVQGLIDEMRRRMVISKGLVCLGSCWLIVQVVTQVFPVFDCPTWAIRGIVIMAAAIAPLVALGHWLKHEPVRQRLKLLTLVVLLLIWTAVQRLESSEVETAGATPISIVAQPDPKRQASTAPAGTHGKPPTKQVAGAKKLPPLPTISSCPDLHTSSIDIDQTPRTAAHQNNAEVVGSACTRELVPDARSLSRIAPEQSLSVIEEVLKGRAFYESGDYEKAVQLFENLKDVPEAEYFLGVAYQHGRGVPQSYYMAVYYYELSASKEFGFAENNLAGLYYAGHGVEQSYEKAANLFRLASNHGIGRASHNLGEMYQLGLGVPQSFDEASRLYELTMVQAQAVDP